MSSRQKLTFVFIVLAVAAIWQLGMAGWIHTKAIAAQILLDRAWQQKIELVDGMDHPGIRTAWARNKIESLLEQHHDSTTAEQRDELKNQIVQTSIKHHLVSRFASLVAVDVTAVNSSGHLHSEKLKNNLPHGWKQGRSPSPTGQQMLMAQLNLPQTATTASLHLIIASMLFSLAMVFYLIRKAL